MTCQNCKDPDCKVAEAQAAADKANRYGNAVAWRNCSMALEAAQSDCAHRAAYPQTDLSARLDRIEAFLREKGWVP